MKHLFSRLLVGLTLAGTVLTACATPPIPVTGATAVATATNTGIAVPINLTLVPSATSAASPTSPSPTTEASPTVTPTPEVTPTPGGFPDIPIPSLPQGSAFQGCPAEGDGGDPKLNAFKNRMDAGNYVPVAFDTILNLTWPKTTERRDMATWSPADAAAIAKYEGIPVTVEGYLFGAKQSGPESANCHAMASDMNDWHIWFTRTPGEDRTHSIVVETTGRIRASHQWSLTELNQIAKDQTRVRISGWLFFDPEHPDQLLVTRGTLWEIHPIMQIEVLQNGQWVPLDDVAP